MQRPPDDLQQQVRDLVDKHGFTQTIISLTIVAGMMAGEQLDQQLAAAYATIREMLDELLKKGGVHG